MKILTIVGKSVIPAMAGGLICLFVWGITGSIGAGFLFGGIGALLLFLGFLFGGIGALLLFLKIS